MNESKSDRTIVLTVSAKDEAGNIHEGSTSIIRDLESLFDEYIKLKILFDNWIKN